MKHDLKFMDESEDGTIRMYICSVCKQRVRLVAPILFLSYAHRYDDLLANVRDFEDCSGPPPNPVAVGPLGDSSTCCS